MIQITSSGVTIWSSWDNNNIRNIFLLFLFAVWSCLHFSMIGNLEVTVAITFIYAYKDVRPFFNETDTFTEEKSVEKPLARMGNPETLALITEILKHVFRSALKT